MYRYVLSKNHPVNSVNTVETIKAVTPPSRCFVVPRDSDALCQHRQMRMPDPRVDEPILPRRRAKCRASRLRLSQVRATCGPDLNQTRLGSYSTNETDETRVFESPLSTF